MPPFRLLCALVSAALRRQPLDPELVAKLSRRQVDWARMVTLSGVHLLTPALRRPLADESVRDHVPEELGHYLEAIHDAATARNIALRTQLGQVAGALNGCGVVPVLLKGGIRLVDDLWPDPALRFMHDLDLLVPESLLAACAERLAVAGWHPIPGRADELTHHLILVHAEAVARIELHRMPLPPPYGQLLPAVRMLTRAQPVPLGEAMVALPSIEDQLVHLVAHGMLHHAFLRNGRFLLRDIAELKLLIGRASEGERSAACQRFKSAGQALAWDTALELCARCLDGGPGGRTLASRMLAVRMLLQQRSALAMQLLGPPGWLIARLLNNPLAKPLPLTPRKLAIRLKAFRRKTMW